MPSYANHASQLIGRNKFRVKAYKSRITGKIVTNSLGNISQSNIIGFYDKRDRNLGPKAPMCRTTAFTSQQVDKWKNTLPLIKCIDSQFKKLILKFKSDDFIATLFIKLFELFSIKYVYPFLL